MALWILFLGLGDADAFCGTYVGSTGGALHNQRSEVAMAREDDRTTLTLRNDYQGERADFALVIPVPEVIPEEDVHVVDPEVFERLDAYSTPRIVEYTCDSGAWLDSGGWPDSDITDSDIYLDTGTVEVVEQYIVGEYDIVILSAQQSAGLFTWLENGGYQLPESSQPLLQEYIDGGSYFLAAKVAADDLPGDVATEPTELSPLQIAYTASAWTLPIRIGTLNADGAQDLLVYTLTSTTDGRTGISNYPEATLQTACVLPENADADTFYEAQFEAAHEAAGDGAAWATEYAWASGACDPCSSDPPSESDLVTLGYGGAPYDVFFTRLHARYDVDSATQDLVLYSTGLTDSHQQRYVTPDSGDCHGLSTCDDDFYEQPDDDDPDPDDTDVEDSDPADHTPSDNEPRTGCGCNSGGLGGSVGLLALFGLTVLRRTTRFTPGVSSHGAE